ncbi:MAG: hypothetical protein JSR45_14045 [Proteobacteria bacterium]|nr:hypothetical protein [Pseudomonadota bacterium]
MDLVAPDIRDALAARAEAHEAISQLDLRARETAAEAAELERQIERLVEAEKRDAARRFLDGEDAVPANAARRKKLQLARARLGEANASAPLLAERRAAALAQLRTAQDDLTGKVLTTFNDARQAHATRIRDAIERLLPDLADLIALELVQTKLVGTKFEFNRESGVPELFSGEVVAKRFIESLPARLRPPNFNLDAAMELATAEARRLTETLEGACSHG